MKKNRFDVGIIGNGFVGESLAFAFSPTTNIKIYDINPLKSLNTLNEIYKCDFVFVCVPTPMYNDGNQNLEFINDVFKKASKGPIYIIKSTVLPETTKNLCEKYNSLDIIFNPEFLTERTAKLDMITQARIVLGGDKSLIARVRELYEQRFMNRTFIETDSTTAEIIKYMNNTFFATKVSIMNEYKLLVDALGANWSDAVYGFASDHRIGDSHLHVPGPDGKLGYGGTCFPKDVNSLINFAKKYDIELNTIKGGWKTNLKVRSEKDWEKLKGRAVT